jgi:hypothetical protein
VVGDQDPAQTSQAELPAVGVDKGEALARGSVLDQGLHRVAQDRVLDTQVLDLAPVLP